MKIRKILIRNYRSLKEASLEDLGDLTILIGTNSSGKSNLLEAMFVFFNEFDPSLERNIGSIDEYVWFDRVPEEPVEFTFTFELGKMELADLIPSEILEEIEVKEKNALEIVRVIMGKPNSAAWRTQEVKVNNTSLIKDGKFVFETKKEEQPQPELPSEEKQPVRKPRKPPSDFSGAILQNIAKKVKGKFRLVSAARNVPTTSSGLFMRSAFLQPQLIGDLTSLGQPIGRPRSEERQWIDIDENVRKICRTISDLRIMGSRVTTREKGSDMYFPIEATGGGYQEIVGLVCQLMKEEDVAFGIEEPELHLHPELARQFLSVMKGLSLKNQIFVTTHSTAFVDKADLQNTWIIRKEKKETHVFRMKEPKELKNILDELGLRPSDIFYANGLIFVEGQTEKIVLPIWAAKMGIDFDKLGISLIPTYGKASGRYHLTVWTDAAENTGIPYYFILDKDAQDQAKKLKERLLPEENLFLLKRGSIEEYYPTEKIIEALKKEYQIEISAENGRLESPIEKSIEKLLKSKVKDITGWKIAVGSIVAESMSLTEIDDEIRRIFERIRTRHEQIFR